MIVGRGKNDVVRCAPDADARSAAYFDVDGTLIQTTIVHYYVYFRFRFLPSWKAMFWFPWFLAKCGVYRILDKFDRSRLNIIVYRNYAGLPVDQIKAAAEHCVRRIARGRWLAGACQAIDEHRRAGRRIVLVTGSLDFLMEPLAGMIGGADILAAALEEKDGHFTGRLVGGPVIGDEKARRMGIHAREHALQLKKSHAYGDSSADLAMLEAVGFAHAVNPDHKLRAVAAKKGWAVHCWPVEGAGKKTSPQEGRDLDNPDTKETEKHHTHPIPLPQGEGQA